MITRTETVGLTAGHTDVSLWNVVQGRVETPIVFDGQKFNTVKWLPFSEVPYECGDPHMRRFIQKLSTSCAYGRSAESRLKGRKPSLASVVDRWR